MTRTRKKLILILLIGFGVIWTFLPSVSFAADNLQIYVGYFGGPYYLKTELSMSEVKAMGTEQHVYSFIDNSPSVCLDCATGVKLSLVIENSGIDLSAVNKFFFFTGDNYNPEWESTKGALIDSSRYYYPKLLENFTSSEGARKAASKGAVAVPTILAVSDDWHRYSEGESFEKNFNSQTTQNRFRLLFGQSSTADKSAGKALKYINKINVTLDGAPTLSLSTNEIKGKIGSEKKVCVNINSADSTITKNIKKKVAWSSENKKIATVDQDGNITIKGKGETVITASYGDIGASVIINGTKKDSGTGTKNGKGTGTNGSGNGSNGSGTGSTTGKTTGKAKEVALGKNGEIISQNKSGGSKKNYKVYEMDQAESKLPKTDENKYLLQTGIIAGTILLLSMGGEAIGFRRRLKG